MHSTTFTACSPREPGKGTGAGVIPTSLRSAARHRIRVSLARALVIQATRTRAAFDEPVVSAWAIVAIEVFLQPTVHDLALLGPPALFRLTSTTAAHTVIVRHPTTHAVAYDQLLTPEPFGFTSVPNQEEYDELVALQPTTTAPTRKVGRRGRAHRAVWVPVAEEDHRQASLDGCQPDGLIRRAW